MGRDHAGVGVVQKRNMTKQEMSMNKSECIRNSFEDFEEATVPNNHTVRDMHGNNRNSYTSPHRLDCLDMFATAIATDRNSSVHDSIQSFFKTGHYCW